MFNYLHAKHHENWQKCVEKRNLRGNDNRKTKRRNIQMDEEEKSEIDELSMEMVAMDLKPFSCVEDKGFRKLLKRLAPNYDPSCRTTLSRQLAPMLYLKTKNSLLTELTNDVKSGLMSLCFTTDCWTSRAEDSYICLTVHYSTQDFDRKNITLEMEQLHERHTGLYLHSTLQKMMEEWELNELNIPIYFVTDNARNLSIYLFHTRWNSEYGMLERIEKLKISLSQVLSNIETIDNFTGSEWKAVNQFIKVLKPLYDATVISSGTKYPMVLPMLRGIKLKLENINVDDDMINQLASSSIEALSTRFGDVERIEDNDDPNHYQIANCKAYNQSVLLLVRNNLYLKQYPG